MDAARWVPPVRRPGGRWTLALVAVSVSCLATPPHAAGTVSKAPPLPPKVEPDGPLLEAPPHRLPPSDPAAAFADSPHDVLAQPDRVLSVSAYPSAAGSQAAFAIDGRPETSWSGLPGADRWIYSITLRGPTQLALLRARFGRSPTHGVPTTYAWEVARPDATGACGVPAFAPLEGAHDEGTSAVALPTRRSWFLGDSALVCALRLVVRAANGGGPPVLAELVAIEGARNVLRDAEASCEGCAMPGGANDGTYAQAFVGERGRSAWTLTLALPGEATLDRLHLVLGEDATSRPRVNGVGRRYGVSRMPTGLRVETSVDGVEWSGLPAVDDRPIRRRLLTFAARPVRAIRIRMTGATGEDGAPDLAGFPVIREVRGYAADDRAPLVLPPTILAVNANPAGSVHEQPGGELANDVYWTKFLQRRFASLIPALRSDDRYDRMLGPTGALMPAARTAHAGEVLEAIEGDDPTLDGAFLGAQTPRPLVVLSGSNNWDFARATGPGDKRPKTTRWRWDPLADAARFGGMGQLATGVHERVAPFLGFCGGAQILALLEGRGDELAEHPNAKFTAWDDAARIDATLRRTTGRPIRGFPPADAVLRAWPGDSHPREEVTFAAADRLFADLTGARGRSITHAFPESHADVVRPSAFLPGGPLARFEVLARSEFCSPKVVGAGPDDPATPDPDDPVGRSHCATTPEVFRSETPSTYPILGAQFHAEQTDFQSAAGGDPPESVADARLFFAAAYESIVDAYARLAR